MYKPSDFHLGQHVSFSTKLTNRASGESKQVDASGEIIRISLARCHEPGAPEGAECATFVVEGVINGLESLMLVGTHTENLRILDCPPDSKPRPFRYTDPRVGKKARAVFRDHDTGIDIDAVGRIVVLEAVINPSGEESASVTIIDETSQYNVLVEELTLLPEEA